MARPKVLPDGSKLVAVRTSRESREWLEARALRDQTTISEVLRQLLKDAMKGSP